MDRLPRTSTTVAVIRYVPGASAGMLSPSPIAGTVPSGRLTVAVHDATAASALQTKRTGATSPGVRRVPAGGLVIETVVAGGKVTDAGVAGGSIPTREPMFDAPLR